MRPHTPATGAVAIPAHVRTDLIKQNTLFRLGVFGLSVAVGFFFSRFLYTGLRLLQPLAAQAHAKGTPIADVLRTLHSGFGN